jgi:hypothetical protein
MPAQNRVGVTIVATWAQQQPAQTLPVLANRHWSLSVSRTHASSAQLRAEDPIFFKQIHDGRLPLVAPPTLKGHQHEPERRALHQVGDARERPLIPGIVWFRHVCIELTHVSGDAGQGP